MTELQKVFFIGVGVGALLVLIFAWCWFSAKLEEYRSAHELIQTNYMQFMEKKLQYTAIENYCKGLAQARMMVLYLKRGYDRDRKATPEQLICNQVLEKLGEKMQPAEGELEIRHAILKGHKHEV